MDKLSLEGHSKALIAATLGIWSNTVAAMIRACQNEVGEEHLASGEAKADLNRHLAGRIDRCLETGRVGHDRFDGA